MPLKEEFNNSLEAMEGNVILGGPIEIAQNLFR